MYEVLVPKSVIKEIKRLGKSTAQKVRKAIEEIAENPYRGVPLKGDLSSIHKWVIQDQGIQYRIAMKFMKIELRLKLFVLVHEKIFMMN